MERIVNSAFSKFEGKQFSNLGQIYGGGRWQATQSQGQQNGCCVDIYDKENTHSGRFKVTKIIMECSVAEYGDPEYDGLTEWDEEGYYQL